MANPASQDEDDEAPRSWRAWIADTRTWDKFIIGIAAILTGCFIAFMFKPSFAPAITKVFEDATAMQEAEARRLSAPPPPTPGEVNMTLFPTRPAPAPPAPGKN